MECEWRVCVSSTDALVFLFVRSTISRRPAGRFTPKFACGRTLVPDVSSPLLGVSGLQRTEKLLKIEAYKQHREISFLSPMQLSHVFGPIAHGVLQGEPKSK